MDVGSSVDISWNGSYYEFDKTLFEGLAIFNDSLTRDHVDEAWIGTSVIVDSKYSELTAFESNSVHCVWHAPALRPWWEAFWSTNATTTVENQPANTSSQKQSADAYNSWAVVIIAVTIGIGLLVTLLILVNSGKKFKSSSDKRNVVQPNRNINTYTSKH